MSKVIKTITMLLSSVVVNDCGFSSIKTITQKFSRRFSKTKNAL